MDGLQDLQAYDVLRIITSLLAVAAAYRLALRAMKDHRTYSTRLAEWVWIVLLTLFTIFEGMWESVLKNADWRYGTLLSFLIACAALRASRDEGPLQSTEEILKQQIEEGTMSVNEIRNILYPPDSKGPDA